MPEQEILDRIAELIRDQTEFAGPIAADTAFRDDLAMDSLSTVELISATERAFDVLIPYEELDDFDSVGELADYVAKLRTG
ncbi:acyl carrier protein [Streptomyces sp.]|uniref:acyl carrier protein n=1 Tax=Streptomyces sp. TaxID=1931 RepID=UPI002C649C32|nr:acyl carrier protein [Streptomyces sp.]HLL34969.1 acyl carrier protein [Streptomyces sp.]HZF89354.1 acyl carrier protein [Streptomyces sp.]